MEDKERPEETPADVEAHANAPKAGAPKAGRLKDDEGDDVEAHAYAPKAGAPKAG
jgi:hypothetical protein